MITPMEIPVCSFFDYFLMHFWSLFLILMHTNDNNHTWYSAWWVIFIYFVVVFWLWKSFHIELNEHVWIYFCMNPNSFCTKRSTGYRISILKLMSNHPEKMEIELAFHNCVATKKLLKSAYNIISLMYFAFIIAAR